MGSRTTPCRTSWSGSAMRTPTSYRISRGTCSRGHNRRSPSTTASKRSASASPPPGRERPERPSASRRYLDIRHKCVVLSKVEVSLNGGRMADRADLLQGTLDLLILKTLVLGSLHGWGISKRLRQLSRDVLDVGQGSLYPALYRLEDQGWITAEW